jgi:plastocyanin
MTGAVRHAVVIVLLLRGVAVHAASLGGRVSLDGAPAVNAVIYLDGVPAGPASSVPPRAVMDQKNLTFIPKVLPVVRGTVVDFTNSDDVQHNVFTPSAIAAKFNLGTYDPGAVRSVTFIEPGDVLVLCNIHMEMEAHILVLDGPYFSAVGPDGRYRIANVPAGTYGLKIWREHWLAFTKTVNLPAVGDLTVDVAAEK